MPSGDSIATWTFTGLVPADGTPVVATAYSGNLQFMSDDNSWLVDYDLVEVDRAEGPFQRGSVWAEADVEHAARLLRTVHDGGADLAKRTERARRSVVEQLSPVAVGRQVESLLRG